MTAGMSHLMFDRSIHSHCCPHKYFSASCSRWLPLCLTPAGLESEPAVCQLSLPHVVLGQFIPVAIFEKEYSDYIHLYWMICSSVPLSLFIIHARVTLYVLCCIYHPLTSSCKFLIIYSTSNATKKGQSFVTRDLSLFTPEAFFMAEEFGPSDLQWFSFPQLPLHLLALPIAPCLCVQVWSKIQEHKWMLLWNC